MTKKLISGSKTFRRILNKALFNFIITELVSNTIPVLVSLPGFCLVWMLVLHARVYDSNRVGLLILVNPACGLLLFLYFHLLPNPELWDCSYLSHAILLASSTLHYLYVHIIQFICLPHKRKKFHPLSQLRDGGSAK